MKAIYKEKLDTFLFVAVLVLIYVSICVETDMYVPAFPSMVRDLGTTEDKIQAVIGINFLGLCFSSLWSGPLADSFGRRRIILGGLTLFVAASFGCIWSQTLPMLKTWRFIQGMGAGVPMTVGFAILLDRFSAKTSASLMGVMNTVITLSMAGAPLVGSWITFRYHWRMNFIAIAVLGTLAWLSFFIVIPETLPKKERSGFKIKRILKDCGQMLTHPRFVGYTLTFTLILSGVFVFVANQSLIFLNHLGVSPEVYGFYQASSMASFAFTSLMSPAFIRRYSVMGAKRGCMALIAAGGAFLLGTALFLPDNAEMICFSMVLINLGGGLGIGSLAATAVEFFPDLRATASGVMGFLRLLIMSVMVGVSSHFFDGTILPIAILVSAAQFITCVIFWRLRKAKGDSAHKVLEAEPISVVH